jgi:predicted nuclease with TOPRIM domain
MITGCQTNSKKEKINKSVYSQSSRKTHETPTEKLQMDTAATLNLKESINKEDEIVNDHLNEELKTIRENFKRINSISNWTVIDKKELRETTEGIEAQYFYTNDKLEKIITHHFGEMFQKLTEYYLLNKELSFVFEKSFKYNRPIYYDSTMMKENNDSEVFDIEKSEITENRSYFINGKLIHQTNNLDCGSPTADEQIRLKNMYNELIKNK